MQKGSQVGINRWKKRRKERQENKRVCMDVVRAGMLSAGVTDEDADGRETRK